MKNIWRKPYPCDLLCDYILFGSSILFLTSLLFFQIIKISNGTFLIIRSTRFIILSITLLIAIILLSGIYLYRKSMSYILWYKEILDAIPMPLIITDEDARWQQVNQATLEIIDIEQDGSVEKLHSRHLFGEDGVITNKIWQHKGTEYLINGTRLQCGGKDVGYLISLSDTTGVNKANPKFISEINAHLIHLSTEISHFRNCTNNLSEHMVWQADIITDLFDIIAEIVSGVLDDPVALNHRIHIVKADMLRHAENSQTDLENMRRIVKELNDIRDCAGSFIPHNSKVS